LHHPTCKTDAGQTCARRRALEVKSDAFNPTWFCLEDFPTGDPFAR
jgi:hypothetical protein